MNKVPVQNVIPGVIEPFPLLVFIVTCLVGDQQPFAFLTNASQGTLFAYVHRTFGDQFIASARATFFCILSEAPRCG
jgi:hypothetical protein